MQFSSAGVNARESDVGAGSSLFAEVYRGKGVERFRVYVCMCVRRCWEFGNWISFTF